MITLPTTYAPPPYVFFFSFHVLVNTNKGIDASLRG